MPKTSSNDQISAAFKEIVKVLNNLKLRERFLNANKVNEIINEIVKIFDRKTVRRPRVNSSQNMGRDSNVVVRSSHNPNTGEIKHVPTRR